MVIDLSISKKDSNDCKKKQGLNYNELRFLGNRIEYEINHKYKTIADVIFYNNWIEYGSKFNNYEIDENRIYRGQSNYMDINGKCLNFWEITSNLNRVKPGFPLSGFFQNLAKSKEYLENYSCFNIVDNNKQPNIVEISSYLQHYGLATPFVDFTYDPITALFFALSSFPYLNKGYQRSKVHYFSVFEINTGILREVFGIKDFDNNLKPEYDFYISHPNYNKEELNDYLLSTSDVSQQDGPYIAIYNNKEEVSSIINENIKKQNGTFLLIHIPNDVFFDNKLENNSMSFEKLLTWYLETKNIKLKNKPIKLHLIPFESIETNHDRGNGCWEQNLLYAYFKEKGKTGKDLFNDIVGFNYDFMFNNIKDVAESDPFIENGTKTKEVLKANNLI